MKLSQKSTAGKRVFVSIREKPKVSITCAKPLSKPPIQPGQFVRKKGESVRSQTPEQFSYKPVPKTNTNLPTRRSLSPFVQNYIDTNSYYLPREPETMLTIPVAEKEHTQCLPYELDTVTHKPPRYSAVKKVRKNTSKNIDLTPGIFSQKQMLSDSNLLKKEKKQCENSKLFGSAGFVHIDEYSTVASRTPSPILQPRSSRCKTLSKNFKINKQVFASEVGKQLEDNSVDEIKLAYVLNGVEDLAQKVEFSQVMIGSDRPRVPIKLVRG